MGSRYNRQQLQQQRQAQKPATKGARARAPPPPLKNVYLGDGAPLHGGRQARQYVDSPWPGYVRVSALEPERDYGCRQQEDMRTPRACGSERSGRAGYHESYESRLPRSRDRDTDTVFGEQEVRGIRFRRGVMAEGLASASRDERWGTNPEQAGLRRRSTVGGGQGPSSTSRGHDTFRAYSERAGPRRRSTVTGPLGPLDEPESRNMKSETDNMNSNTDDNDESCENDYPRGRRPTRDGRKRQRWHVSWSDESDLDYERRRSRIALQRDKEEPCFETRHRRSYGTSDTTGRQDFRAAIDRYSIPDAEREREWEALRPGKGIQTQGCRVSEPTTTMAGHTARAKEGGGARAARRLRPRPSSSAGHEDSSEQQRRPCRRRHPSPAAAAKGKVDTPYGLDPPSPSRSLPQHRTWRRTWRETVCENGVGISAVSTVVSTVAAAMVLSKALRRLD
ncbi:hypothetical protein MMC24_003658 [Lignoscripta atroalba]|nr:hypothetical protein [Lignoscripta atroalba]